MGAALFSPVYLLFSLFDGCCIDLSSVDYFRNLKKKIFLMSCSINISEHLNSQHENFNDPKLSSTFPSPIPLITSVILIFMLLGFLIVTFCAITITRVSCLIHRLILKVKIQVDWGYYDYIDVGHG